MDDQGTIKRCRLCATDPETRRYSQRDELESGKECPICYAPTCRLHLATVRWRWKNGGETAATQICRECKRTYRHRSWDTLNRDWIS